MLPFSTHLRNSITYMAKFTQGGEWLLKIGKFCYGGSFISLDISMSFCTISLFESIKGQQRSSWSLFRTFTCWSCLKHLVNLAKKMHLINKSWLYTINIHILWNIGLTVEKKKNPRGRMTTKEYDNFFYCETSISLDIGTVLYTIRLYVSIKGPPP